MRKSGRLNDTKALVSVAAPSEQNEEVTVSVRRIDNGYVKRVSSYGPGGGYECKEEYSAEKPSAMPTSENSSGKSLKGATRFLNKN